MASAKQQSTTTKRSSSKRGSSKRATARRSATTAVAAELVCPECGKTFTRAASLGAHRNRAHGVAGSSKPASARRNTASKTGASRRKTATARRTSKDSGTSAPNASGAGGVRRVRQLSDGHINRDSLLQSLFPTGIPAREDAIREVNAWLDEAERLARMRS